MIVTRKSGLLVAALVLFFVLFQNTFLSRIEFLGTSVWALPAVALVFGLLGGSLLGATVGFGVGLLADGLGDSPLGLSCLVFMAIGYLGGYYRERVGRPGQLAVVGLCAAAVAAANLAFGFYGVVTGVEAPVTWGVMPDILLQALYGAVIALPVYALIYRVLRPALILEVRAPRRRRPAGTLTEVDGEV